MFKIGDRVVYPRRGCGVIETIEERTILDKPQEYIIVKIFDGNMTIMLPTNMSAQSHFRLLSDSDTANAALESLTETSTPPAETIASKQRLKDNMAKITAGSLMEYAEVVRDLTHIHKLKPLNSGERNILVSARKFFVDEISLIKDISKTEVDHMIDTLVN
ncbi:MAG: CarD family transcriptional regulator [Cellulosilyticaceae bacterium]